MSHKFFFGLILSAGIGSMTVLAQADNKEQKKKPPSVEELLKVDAKTFIKRFDKNKDGKLEKDELPPRLAEAFPKIDRNSDGKLDAKEVDEMMNMFRKRLAKDKPQPSQPKKDAAAPPETANVPDFDSLDRNADGRLTREELKGKPLADHFERIDVNKDGKIDPKEYAAYFKKREEKKN